MIKKKDILGIKFDLINLNQVVDKIFLSLYSNKKIFIVTANPEIVIKARKDLELNKAIKNADIVTADGIGVVIAMRLYNIKINRVTGFDIVQKIFERSNKNKENKYKFFLLGSNKKNIKLAQINIKRKYKNIEICGYNDGYFDDKDKIIDLINNSKTDILLIGMGSPLQEKFIFLNKKKINAKVFIGVGGTFDVLSGKIKRAPTIFQKLGLEWFYRILKEPKRILRSTAIIKFIFIFLFKR
jgi:N-acetylglucosaminyldiphosphoundecaprenol N-acetyl-beta-D-mannosaminyltransferase